MHICPVCGYEKLSKPPYFFGGGGSYEICPSCGFEFGVSDDDAGITHEQWRQQWIGTGNQWIKGGMSWASRSQPPIGWNPKKNLKNIGIYLGEE